MAESLVAWETMACFWYPSTHTFYQRALAYTGHSQKNCSRIPDRKAIIEMSDFLEYLAAYGLIAFIAGLSLFYGLWFIALHIAQPQNLLLVLFPRQEHAKTILLASCVACVGFLGIVVGISLCGDTLRTRATRIQSMKAQERQRIRDQGSDSEEEIIVGQGPVSLEEKKHL